MASAFLNFAASSAFTTARNTSYDVKGLVLLNAGSQFCYAYNTVAELAGSKFWKACGPGGSSAGSSVGGCCPANLTEDYCKSVSAECSHINLSIHMARMLRQRVLLFIDDTFQTGATLTSILTIRRHCLCNRSLTTMPTLMRLASTTRYSLVQMPLSCMLADYRWLVRMRHYANAMCGVPYC